MMRKFEQRVRRPSVGVCARSSARTAIAYRPLSARRSKYVQLVNGEFATGSKTSIVFAVDDFRVDAHSVSDVFGLALALAERGHGVQVIKTGAPVPDADVLVGTSRGFDPSAGAPDALRVAWARTEIDRWVALPFLSAYDVVLAPSPMALARLRREFPRVELFRPAADTELFGAAGERGAPAARSNRRGTEGSHAIPHAVDARPQPRGHRPRTSRVPQVRSGDAPVPGSGCQRRRAADQRGHRHPRAWTDRYSGCRRREGPPAGPSVAAIARPTPRTRDSTSGTRRC